MFLCNPPQAFKKQVENMSDFQLLVVLLLYVTWDCRNRAIFADEKIDLASFFNKLNGSFSEHKHLSKNGLYDHHTEKKLLKTGWTVIYTDAAFWENGACLAGIAKDEGGLQLAWFHHSLHPGQAEAKAVFLAASLTSTRG